MNRPKSASSTSFLDDLFGNEIENAVSTSIGNTTNQRQRKSVRFFDEDDDNDPTIRPHSSTLDSLLNSSKAKNQDSTSGKSKVDWLGISSSEDETAKTTQDNAPTRPATTPFTNLIAPRGRAQSSLNTSSSSGSDWLSQGLRARQNAAQSKESPKTLAADILESQAPSSSSSLKPELRTWQPNILNQYAPIETSTAQTTSIINVTTTVTGQMVNTLTTPSTSSSSPQTMVTTQMNSSKSQQQIQQPQPSQPISIHKAETIQASTIEQKSIKVPELNELSGIDSNFLLGNVDQTSIAYLQTQLRMMTLEKQFLEQTVEQMKNNHQDELNAMVSLYEQQMRLTSEMYKRHEGMIQEEHDQRLNELKSHLQKLEEEMSSMRGKYQERMVQMENEWKADLAKIKEMHANNVAQINDEHQHEIQWLEQKLKFETDDTIQTSNDLLKRQSKAISEMLAKWEESAHRIELLQKSVITRQEELARERQNTADEQQLNEKDIEVQWKYFLDAFQKEREEFEKVIENERARIETQAVKQFEVDRLAVMNERKEIEKMKIDFAQEVNEWRERETADAMKTQKEREKLREEVLVFEQRRAMLETLYNERKEMLKQEQTRLAIQTEEVYKKKDELDKQQSELMKTMFSIKENEEQIKLKQEQFNLEKEQLKHLGETLYHRAGELERLSEMTLQEKLEGLQAIDQIDAFRSEIASKMAIIEESTEQLRGEEKKIAMKQTHLEQQWLMIKELKDTIVCNLCGATISQAKLWPTKFALRPYEEQKNGLPIFYGLMNGFLKEQPKQLLRGESPSSDEMNDHNLLLWQVASQKDAASLAEETNFLNIMLREKQKQINKDLSSNRIDMTKLK